MSEKTPAACRLCPRNCGADRAGGKTGYCGADDRVMVARAALHMWEEPCISGTNGSGAVFFCGCPLHCVYCQNREISGGGSGTAVTVPELAEIFLRLQEQKAHNINLVTAGHYAPQAAEAIRLAKARGLSVPIVWNSSGYEKVETLRMLEGLVDIWLPDFKYMDPQLAARLSRAPDYPRVAMAALAEMVRQAESRARAECDKAMKDPMRGSMKSLAEKPLEGSMKSLVEKPLEEPLEESPEAFTEEGIMRRGVIVRHLLLPGYVKQSKQVVSELLKAYGNRIRISLMSQYTPMPAVAGDPLLSRRVTRREYERLISYALDLGMEKGFIQERDVAKESFIPAFDGTGVTDEDG